jgi:hypothetical protein
MKPIALLALTLVLFLLIPSMSVAQIDKVPPTRHSTYHKGDSYTTNYYPTEITPKNGTEQPKIEITSLINHTVLYSNNVTLNFNLILDTPTNYSSISPYHPLTITLEGICYKPSWQPVNTTFSFEPNTESANKTLPFSITFTNMSDGEKTVTIYASALYEFVTKIENVRQPVSPSGMIVGNFVNIYSNYYFMEGSSSIAFTIDTAPTPTNTLNGKSSTNNGMSTLIYPVIVSIVLVLIGAISLLLYRHRQVKKV